MSGFKPVRAGARLDWQNDWTSWLADGDSISTRVWTIDPTGPDLTGATSATVLVEGFVSGKVYRLTEAIVTANGLEDERTLVLRVI